MPYYMVQAAYTPESWAAQIKAQPDPRVRIGALAEAVGGRLDSLFYCFGEYDIVGIAEFPSNEAAAAFSITASAGGAGKAIKTTPLMTVEEGLSFMKKASDASRAYRPPT
jgi:uncharacterized protein with GYD domain